jgi:RimJ/RimL family protein N-acetyltransferase
MRSGVQAATRHLFIPSSDGGLGASRAFIKAAAGNAASQYVAVANDYAEYGRERHAERLGDGSWTDLVLFEALAHEWTGRAS